MASERASVRQRRVVAERAAGRCEYCRSPSDLSSSPFAVEHIVPRSKKGKTRLNNLALCCQGCNGHKYNKTEALDPATGVKVRLFNPRKHSWIDHFAWSDDATLVVGLTPTGRATVGALRLNRPALIRLRRILKARNEHPPVEPVEVPGMES